MSDEKKHQNVRTAATVANLKSTIVADADVTTTTTATSATSAISAAAATTTATE